MSNKKTRLLAAVLVFLALGGKAEIVQADNGPLTVVVIDISTSSPFLQIQQAAELLAERVADEIRNAEPGHEFLITTFGQPGFKMPLHVRATVGISGSSRPRRLANAAHELIATIPERYASGDFPGQEYTALTDWIEHFDEGVCRTRSVSILAATDGAEYTNSFDGSAFVRGQISLPAPTEPLLEGCESITLVGVGSSLDRSAVLTNPRLSADASDGIYRVIKPEWEQFLTATGVGRFSVLGRFF